MIQGKWLPMGSDLKEAVMIREAVLQRGEDELDKISQSVLVYNEEGIPVGTGRIFWADGAFWIRDLCVLAKFRGQGFGDLLIRLLLFKALTHSAREIRVVPTDETVAFFAKYGFTTDGSEQMHIFGEKVQLSHCSGNCADCGLCGGK